MNDLPMTDTPLNVQHIQIVNNGKPLPEEHFFPTSQFDLSIIPFIDLLPVILKSTPCYSDTTFGTNFRNDNILKRSFVNTIKPKSPASNIFFNPIYTTNNIRGAFLNSIHCTYVFTSADTLKHIRILH